MTPSPPASADFTLPTGLGGGVARLLGFVFPAPTPILRSERLYIRPPRRLDYLEWSALRAVSHDHLQPWEPLWSAEATGRRAFRHRLKSQAADRKADVAYGYFLFRGDSHRLVGGINVSNVRRGAIQSASLGYWVGAPYAGRGVMTEALGRVLVHLYDDIGLHRIEAACMPENMASRRVLEKCGFTYEGTARRYRQIAGAFRDHMLFAKLAGDPR